MFSASYLISCTLTIENKQVFLPTSVRMLVCSDIYSFNIFQGTPLVINRSGDQHNLIHANELHISMFWLLHCLMVLKADKAIKLVTTIAGLYGVPAPSLFPIHFHHYLQMNGAKNHFPQNFQQLFFHISARRYKTHLWSSSWNFSLCLNFTASNFVDLSLINFYGFAAQAYFLELVT